MLKTVARFLKPDLARIALFALFSVIAFGAYAQSRAFSDAPPLAHLFDALPLLWQVWVILLLPLLLALRLARLDNLFNTGHAWFFWTLQLLWFYLLASLLGLAGQKLARHMRQRNSVQRMTYKKLLNKLVAANEWLTRLGLREQQDRIRQHITRIERLEAARAAGNLIAATQGEEGRLAMFSFAEAMEFVHVFRAFEHGGPADLPRRLKDALDGPADLKEESPRSSRGRNTMFELNLASRLARRGVPVSLPVNPDILTEISSKPVFIQCKRPFKPETIPENIHDAARQLLRDLNGSGSAAARGIVAISVARAFNRGDQIFAGPDEPSIKQRLGDHVQWLAESYAQWREIADPRIVGILFHVITPAHIQNIRLLTVAQEAVVFSLPNRPASDVALARAFADLIRE